MALSRPLARELARRFLSVFGVVPPAPTNATAEAIAAAMAEWEAKIIEWDIVLNPALVTANETPENFARRLLIVTARHLVGDPAIFVSTPEWSDHLDGLENRREPIGGFVDFLMIGI